MRLIAFTAGAPVLLLLAGLACDAPADPDPVAVRDSGGVRIVESHRPAWDEDTAWRLDGPAVVIGSMDASQTLYRVRDATRLADGRIAIVNRGSGELLMYDGAGQRVAALGGRGSGPGEFPRGPTWAEFLPPDTLLVVDQLGLRVVRFLLDGTHLSTSPLPGILSAIVGPDARLPDGRWLQFGSMPDGPNPTFGSYASTSIAVAAPPDFTAEDTLLAGPGATGVRKQSTWQGQVISINVPTPVGATSYSAQEGDRVALGNGVAYDIPVVDLDGPRLRIRRHVESRPVTDGDFERWMNHRLAGVSDPSSRADQRRWYSDVPVAEQHATYAGLALDVAGNLWVELYRPVGSDAPRLWSVHDSAGAWLGDVAWPEDFQAMEIGEDYILGVWTDSLDVEYVRLYRLVKPGE